MFSKKMICNVYEVFKAEYWKGKTSATDRAYFTKETEMTGSRTSERPHINSFF